VEWILSTFRVGGDPLPREALDTEAEKLLAQLDQDGDGLVSFAEFGEYFEGLATSQDTILAAGDDLDQVNKLRAEALNGITGLTVPAEDVDTNWDKKVGALAVPGSPVAASPDATKWGQMRHNVRAAGAVGAAAREALARQAEEANAAETAAARSAACHTELVPTEVDETLAAEARSFVEANLGRKLACYEPREQLTQQLNGSKYLWKIYIFEDDAAGPFIFVKGFKSWKEDAELQVQGIEQNKTEEDVLGDF